MRQFPNHFVCNEPYKCEQKSMGTVHHKFGAVVRRQRDELAGGKHKEQNEEIYKHTDNAVHFAKYIYTT